MRAFIFCFFVGWFLLTVAFAIRELVYLDVRRAAAFALLALLIAVAGRGISALDEKWRNPDLRT